MAATGARSTSRIFPGWPRHSCSTGVALALLNYGLAPATPMEEIVRQQIRALAWLYRNGDRLGFDPERIVVAGTPPGRTSR